MCLADLFILFESKFALRNIGKFYSTVTYLKADELLAQKVKHVSKG